MKIRIKKNIGNKVAWYSQLPGKEFEVVQSTLPDWENSYQLTPEAIEKEFGKTGFLPQIDKTDAEVLEEVQKSATTNDQEIYGCDLKDFEKSLNNAMNKDPKFIATSLMSDAQELIEMGFSNDARQMLNRAKWVLMQWQPQG